MCDLFKDVNNSNCLALNGSMVGELCFEMHVKQSECVIIFLIILSVVRLSPFGTAATIGLFHQPQMIDDDDDGCGKVGGMKIGKGNRSARRKPAPMPLYSPQIRHDLTPG
jgi:hypothetical protein